MVEPLVIGPLMKVYKRGSGVLLPHNISNSLHTYPSSNSQSTNVNMQFTSMIKGLALATVTFSTTVGASVDKSTYLARLGTSEEPQYTFGKAVWKGEHNGNYYELEGNVGVSPTLPPLCLSRFDVLTNVEQEVIGQLEVLDPGSTAAIHDAASNSTASALSPRNKSDVRQVFPLFSYLSRKTLGSSVLNFTLRL